MGIRELLLLCAALICLMLALWRPVYGLYGYVCYALMRPDLLAFADGKYPFSMAFAIVTFLGAVRNFTAAGVLFESRTARTLLLLQIPIGLSVLFAVRPEYSMPRYGFYSRMIAVLMCLPILIDTERKLRVLLLVMAISLGVVSSKFGLFGLTHGGVILEGGYGDMLDDNNFLALATAMLVPVCWYTAQLFPARNVKLLLYGILLLSIVEVIMSHSRGGSLSLGLGLLLIVSRTRRKIGAAAVVLVCAGAAMYMVRDTYLDRMDTLRAPEEESSAASRITHAKAAFAMTLDYPILGVGFGGFNYAVLAPKYQPELDGAHVAHNSYLQMLVDSGVVALGLYLWLLLGTIWRMKKSAAFWSSLGDPISAIPFALQTSLIVFCIGAGFYSCHRMDFPYMVLLAAASWEMIEKRRIAELEAAPEDAQDGPSADAFSAPEVVGSDQA